MKYIQNISNIWRKQNKILMNCIFKERYLEVKKYTQKNNFCLLRHWTHPAFLEFHQMLHDSFPIQRRNRYHYLFLFDVGIDIIIFFYSTSESISLSFSIQRRNRYHYLFPFDVGIDIIIFFHSTSESISLSFSIREYPVAILSSDMPHNTSIFWPSDM